MLPSATLQDIDIDRVSPIIPNRLNLTHSFSQRGMVPFNFKFLLLAPIEKVIVPFGLAHP